MAFIGPLGTPELIIIMVVLLLLFGAKRLPEMGRSVGRGMREFKDAVTGDEKSSVEPAEISAPSESETNDRQAEDTPAERAERETVS